MFRIFWAIVELHNGQFNSVRAPYNSDMDAYNHADKLKAYRKANPVPLNIEYRIVKVYHPDGIM